eukprot:13976913-Heterocapsa_arctica.AAC.1
MPDQQGDADADDAGPEAVQQRRERQARKPQTALPAAPAAPTLPSLRPRERGHGSDQVTPQGLSRAEA